MPETIETVVARIDERTKNIREDIRSLLDRMGAVEIVAEQTKLYSSRLNILESATTNLADRVNSLEHCKTKEDAQKSILSIIWNCLNQPITIAIIMIIFLIYNKIL